MHALAPDAAALNARGAALDSQGRSDEAGPYFRAALAADPQFGDAACNLGRLLLYEGKIDAAALLFERALELEPGNARFYRHLVFCRSGAIDDAHLRAMERLRAEIDALPDAQQIELHFALAGAYEWRGCYDAAFRALQAGNALKRRTIDYDEPANLRFLAMLQRAFTPVLMAALRGCGNPSERPIFIFGMPRSGTTLVEQLLAAIPHVAGTRELNVFGSALRDLWSTAAGNVPLVKLRELVRAIGDRYVRVTDDLGKNVARVTDKLPANYCFAPLIHLALPDARMIHVRRDPVDTCVSCFATFFGDQAVPYAYDLGEMARQYRAYELVMNSWRDLLPPDRFIEVHYERLVEDFEAEARRLVAFCGLPWSERVGAFYDVQRTVRTASAVQVRQPLYRTAIGRSTRFAAHLGPLLAELSG